MSLSEQIKIKTFSYYFFHLKIYLLIICPIDFVQNIRKINKMISYINGNECVYKNLLKMR